MDEIPTELISTDVIVLAFGVGVVAIVVVVFLLGKFFPGAMKEADDDWRVWGDVDDE